MPAPTLANWLLNVTGPNVSVNGVPVGRQPNLAFVGIPVTSDPLNQQNIITFPPVQGGLSGSLRVSGAATGSLSTKAQVAFCDTSLGAPLVQAPPFSSVTQAWQFGVIDSGDNASQYPVTVSGNGAQIEDPYSPGKFASSVTIRVNSAGATWALSGSTWYLLSAAHPRENVYFFSTSGSLNHQALSFPIPVNSVMALKARWVARDESNVFSSLAGEIIGFFTMGAAGNAPQQASNGWPPSGVLWQFPSGSYAAAYTGVTLGTNEADPGTVLVFLTDGGHQTSWRVELEPIYYP